MEGFSLLLGHLVGDYLLQNDYLALNKVNPHPGPKPPRCHITADGRGILLADEKAFRAVEYLAWAEKHRQWWEGHLACTVHCLLYTLACAATCWWFLPWWSYAIIFVAHWPVDRFRLARVWMTRVSGQVIFATGPLSPWSVILVDNLAHLLVLYALGMAAMLLR